MEGRDPCCGVVGVLDRIPLLRPSQLEKLVHTGVRRRILRDIFGTRESRDRALVREDDGSEERPAFAETIDYASNGERMLLLARCPQSWEKCNWRTFSP